MHRQSCFLIVLCCLAATTVASTTTLEFADQVMFVRPGQTTAECSASVNELIPASASLYIRFNNVRLTEDAEIDDLDFHITSFSPSAFTLQSTSFLVSIVREPDPAERSCTLFSDVDYDTWNYVNTGSNTESRETVSRLNTDNDWDIPNSLLEGVVSQSSWVDLRSDIVIILRPVFPTSVPSNAFWNVNTKPFIDIDWDEESTSSRGGISIAAYIGPIIFVVICLLIICCSIFRRGNIFRSRGGTTKTVTHTTTTVVQPQVTTQVHQPVPQQPVAYGTPMPQPYAQPPQPYATPQPYGTQPGYPPQGQPIDQGYPPQGQPYPPQGQPGPVVPQVDPYANDSPYQ